MPSDQSHHVGDNNRESSRSSEQIENFIENVLRKDLKKYEAYINKMNGEIMEFVQLKNLCENISQHFPDGFKTQMNIGGNFFMSAKVPDAKKVLVNVGLDYYVEFTTDEAVKFCDFKVKSLQNEADVIREKSIETKAHIKLALLSIGEKENLLSAET